MAVYSKIYKRLWKSVKFRGLSDDGKLLFLYLISCPHSNSIGLFHCPEKYIEADLDWNNKRLDKPFAELLQNGFINNDPTHNIILIRKWLQHNSIDNPNQVKKALSDLSEIPAKCCLLSEWKGLVERFSERLVQRLPKGFDNPVTVTVTVTETVTETVAEKPSSPDGDPPASTNHALSVDKLLELYNKELGEHLPKVLELTPGRRDKAKTRLKENSSREFWDSVFHKIRGSPFLLGQNDRGWRASWDWLMGNDKNAVAVIEGKYDLNHNARAPCVPTWIKKKGDEKNATGE